MLIDKGAGLRQTQDLLDTAAEYIDWIKLGFGSSILYPQELLQEKICRVKASGVDVYPGGTLLEIAVVQKRENEFFAQAKELGFTYVEISEGTIDLSGEQRQALIRQAKDYGFGVLSEVGKKDANALFDPLLARRQIEQDLNNGAEMVIVEGRDSGVNVGLYDSAGQVDTDGMETLLKDGMQPHLMFEAPNGSQQKQFIHWLGPNVNLGNVQLPDILALESWRCGLRGDTFATKSQ